MTNEEREDIKRHLDVVTERVRSDIRSVAEGLTADTVRIEGLQDQVGSLEARTDGFQAEMRAWFTRIDQQFARVDARFDRVDERLDRMDRASTAPRAAS